MSDDKPTTSQNVNNKHSPRRQQNLAKDEEDTSTMDTIRKFFAQKLNLNRFSDDTSDICETEVLEKPTFEKLCEHWKTKGFKNIITMVGAGISTSAGIPDFRSPGSGLYDNLQKYNLPHPSAIFEMDYFRYSPQPFFTLAKELYPGSFNPTLAHYFIRLLHDKGLLVRHYTQNIDTLDRLAGIPDEKLVECHGSFYTNHCLGCQKLYSMEWMKEQIFADNTPTCSSCNEIVKPDIVFFGENLPDKFYSLSPRDFAKCDLLIIMGTSLEVQPFASLVDRVGPRCIRLLINRTKVGNDLGILNHYFFGGYGLMFDDPNNTRDVAYTGDCDAGVAELVEAMGWSKELNELMQREQKLLAKQNEKLQDLTISKSAETENDSKQSSTKADSREE